MRSNASAYFDYIKKIGIEESFPTFVFFILTEVKSRNFIKTEFLGSKLL